MIEPREGSSRSSIKGLVGALVLALPLYPYLLLFFALAAMDSSTGAVIFVFVAAAVGWMILAWVIAEFLAKGMGECLEDPPAGDGGLPVLAGAVTVVQPVDSPRGFARPSVQRRRLLRLVRQFDPHRGAVLPLLRHGRRHAGVDRIALESR